MPAVTGTELVIFVLGQLVVAAGIWGGIRADIRHMHDKIKDANDAADDAHSRIDSIMAANWHENHVDRRVKR